jgi:hypothetical protein
MAGFLPFVSGIESDPAARSLVGSAERVNRIDGEATEESQIGPDYRLKMRRLIDV